MIVILLSMRMTLQQALTFGADERKYLSKPNDN